MHTRLTNGDQVYSPHSAIDAATGGLGDWLADIVTGEPATMPHEAPVQDEGQPVRAFPAATAASQSNTDGKPAKRPVFMLQHHPSQLEVQDADLKLYEPNASTISFIE
jgi:putative NIF3 family GTP cyclohydrolase 1 type 2